MGRFATCVGKVTFVGCALLLVAALNGCGPSKPRADVKGLGDFEDGSPQGWTAKEGAEAVVSDEHPSQGKKSLCVKFSKAPYPGVALTVGKQDWSGFDVLRFSVYNAERKEATLSMRIDDAASTDYGTRFNLDAGFKLGAMRRTDIEIPLVALSQGSLESRGLDLDAISSVHLFMGNPEEAVTLHFDDFRLIGEPRTGPDRLTVVDFVETGTLRPQDGTAGTVGETEGLTGPGLKLELRPEGNYPGVGLTGLPACWLTYDLLAFDLVCPEDTPTPSGISMKVIDGSGRSLTFATGLKQGKNTIAFPLDTAGGVALGNVSEFVMFTGKPAEKQLLYVGPLSLERVKSVRGAAVHAAEAPDVRLTLDFSPLVRVGRNTCFAATVRIPLTDATCRVVRCNSTGKQQLTYAVGADAFEGFDAARPVRVWAYFLDHGVWHWTWTEVTAEGDKPMKVLFDDPHAFGR